MGSKIQTEINDKDRWNSGFPSRATRLIQRQEILRVIREDLYQQDFIEVETPLLVRGTTPDPIDSMMVGANYLITSTEYQIKRMLVGGFKKIFTLAKNFRAHEQGRFHSTEFTMLEWARVNEPLSVIEEDAARFVKKAFQKIYPDQTTLHFNGHKINLMGCWERLTVREAFKRYLSLENLEDFSLKPLLRAAKNLIPEDLQQDHYLVLSYLLDQLQSHLGIFSPTFLHEWPVFQVASAPVNPDDPFTAERSELYIGGMEIANGFPFLTDACLQNKLFLEAQQRRHEQGLTPVTLDQKFLDALKEGLPPGAGMALGIDRLVMALTGASKISQVQSFEWDEL